MIKLFKSYKLKIKFTIHLYFEKNVMSVSILNSKHRTNVSKIVDLMKEKAFFTSSSSKENFDFNFAKPLDCVASSAMRRA